MAVKISQLSASTDVTSDDFFPIVDSGSMSTKRASAQQVLDYVTGSTFNTLTVTQLVSANAQLTGNFSGTFAGDGTSLVSIPNAALNNSSVTVGSTNISLGGTATTLQGLSVITGSTTTGSKALFDNITASVALFSGDIRVLGTASITQLNTIGQQSLVIGDKYITILSGGVDHTGINGAGFLWGTSSGPGETTGALGEHAHILYDASRDALEIFPGLYVTGSTTVFGISGTTAQFTTLTASNISGTTARFGTLTSSNTLISGNLVLNESVDFSSYPDYAYIIYTSSFDKLVAFPGLYVSGNLTGSGHAKFNEISGTTAQFTVVSASVVSASQYVGLPFANSTFTPVKTTDLGPSGLNTRTVSSTYQNTTGRTIRVAAVIGRSTIGNIVAFVDPSQTVVQLAADGSSSTVYSESLTGGFAVTVDFYVPPNHYYKIINNDGTGTTTIYYWHEYEIFGGGGNVITTGSNTFTGVNTFNTNFITASAGITGSVAQFTTATINSLTGSGTSANITVSGSLSGMVAALTSSAANYTLVAADSGKVIMLSSSSGLTASVPTGLPVGFTTTIVQNGTGSIFVSASSGVTIRNRQSHTRTAGLYAVVTLIGTGSNVYIFAGDTTT